MINSLSSQISLSKVNEEELKERGDLRKMDQNKSAFLIGIFGAIITLSAYSQTFVSPTQCIAAGLFVLGTGLLVREGLISI